MICHYQKFTNELNNICILIIVIIVAIVTIIIMTGGEHMIKIDSDKILNVNDKRIFPVYMYSICNSGYEIASVVAPCNPSDNRELLFGMAGVSTTYTFDRLNYKDLYEQTHVYYTLYGVEIDKIPQYLIDSPYFFGYYQDDEPSDDIVNKISETYNKIKAKDLNHPVILDHWKDMVKWSQYTDIITWDIYPFTETTSYSRDDALYAFEERTEQYFFKGTNLNSINKPVWTVIQANGVPFDKLFVPTSKEARGNTYVAITMDVKGIGYWGYKSYGGTSDTSGLYKNSELHLYYKQLAREITSLNNILVLPTLDYSWQYHTGTKVKFNKILTKTVIYKQFTNFNYIIKRQCNIYYLIVVNKDSRPISDVTISIKGITCNITIRTLGLETQGSGKAGRIINGNNGKFIDSFDGYAAHIYKIRCRYY